MNNEKHKAKILVADDESEIRGILKDFFVQKKYEVDLAESGREAIDKLNAYKPDILLLDMNMPDMDGEEVLKYIDEHDLNVGVIIITAYPDYIKDKKLLGRAYDYIIKPFDLEYLNSTVITKVTLLRGD